MPSSSLLSRPSELLSGSAEQSANRPVTRLAAARVRARRTRRRRAVAISLLLAAVLIGYDLARGGDPLTVSSPFSRPVVTPEPESTSGASDEVPALRVVRQGEGTFAVALGQGPIAGRSGPLVHYRVAVENGTGVGVDEFAIAVERILGHPLGWTAAGLLSLQRVGESDPAQFTIYLASPVTSEAICREDSLETDQYTNCRLQDGRVVINSERWLTAVPNYGAPLSTYQAYAVNHEVGHQLGYGHESCPGPGQPAPVMQQQTLGLDGCVAYAWPYLDGRRYTGPPIPGA